jgi:hypothetical protein
VNGHTLLRAWAASLAFALALPAFAAAAQKEPLGRRPQPRGACMRHASVLADDAVTILSGPADVEELADQAAEAAFASVAFDLAKAGKAGRLKPLIDLSHAILCTRDAGGRTLLHWAARNGSLPVLRLLVEQGADVNAVDYEGMTPLHSLASRGDIEGLRLLLEKGANPELATPEGTTALHLAARAGQIEAVRVLSVHRDDACVRGGIRLPF